MNASRMREPAVVRVPRAQMLSLMATGTPASGSARAFVVGERVDGRGALARTRRR